MGLGWVGKAIGYGLWVNEIPTCRAPPLVLQQVLRGVPVHALHRPRRSAARLRLKGKL